MELKKGCAIISFASSGPPPSLLLGSLTSRPPSMSLASFEIVRGNFTCNKASTYQNLWTNINVLRTHIKNQAASHIYKTPFSQMINGYPWFQMWLSRLKTSKESKFNSRTSHEGPEGEWRYSSTLSLTSALDGGGLSTPRPGCFTPGKELVPTV